MNTHIPTDYAPVPEDWQVERPVDEPHISRVVWCLLALLAVSVVVAVASTFGGR